jgi:hypothetical protein
MTATGSPPSTSTSERSLLPFDGCKSNARADRAPMDAFVSS